MLRRRNLRNGVFTVMSMTPKEMRYTAGGVMVMNGGSSGSLMRRKIKNIDVMQMKKGNPVFFDFVEE